MQRVAYPLLAAGYILFGKAQIAVRLRRAPEGWRRTLGVGLRNEASKFALSSFGLRCPESIGAALLDFLRTEPDAAFSLDHTSSLTVRTAMKGVDLVELSFAPDGALLGVAPHFASHDTAERALRDAAIVSAFNATRHLPERERPLALRNLLARSPGGFDESSRRALSACTFHVEPMPSDVARFEPPNFRRAMSLGWGALHFVIRRDAHAETCDVWVNAHHVATDGAPLQEMMSRLATTWGSEAVLFPEAGTTSSAWLCSRDGEREVHARHLFLDLTPLLGRVR